MRNDVKSTQAGIIKFPAAAARPHPETEAAPPLPPLLIYVPAWERSLIALERRPRGVAKYVWTLRKIILALGDEAITMDDLTYRAVVGYIEGLAIHGYAASTRINDLAVIRSFAR